MSTINPKRLEYQRLSEALEPLGARVAGWDADAFCVLMIALLIPYCESLAGVWAPDAHDRFRAILATSQHPRAGLCARLMPELRRLQVRLYRPGGMLGERFAPEALHGGGMRHLIVSWYLATYDADLEKFASLFPTTCANSLGDDMAHKMELIAQWGGLVERVRIVAWPESMKGCRGQD